jgi:WhiB family redox-sensing transcriptional regulator
MAMRTSSLARLFNTEAENDWRQDAACRGMDPEYFFSSEEIADKRERQEREAGAKAVCARCQVRQECLGYAIEAGERYGVWGGLNPQERRAYVRSTHGDNRSTEQVS